MKILTANRLADGVAVWLTADRSWADTIDDAEIAADKAAEEALERAGKVAALRNEVIDVNLIDVTLVGGRIHPLRLRERIRAAGPTNRTDLGKQARPGAGAAA